VEIIYRVMGKPLRTIGDWVWYVASGQRQLLTVPELIDEITK
jgi:hypothetical protein